MATGLHIGARIGARIGLLIGTDGPSMAGVAKDATSGKFMPANASQWATTLAVASVSNGGPSSLYLLQEASGNPADSIGAFPLTASGTLAYQQAISGWSALGIATTTGVAGKMQSTSASLPNIATTSCALLAYVLLPAGAAALRTVAQLGAGFNTEASAEINSNPKTTIFQCDPNTATGAVDNTNIVRPIWITVDRTNSLATLETDLEALTATLTATPTGQLYVLGGDNVISAFPATCTYLYAVRFDGAAAEKTKAQRRSILQTLAWSPPW